MKSVFLNNELRSKIIENAMKGAFEVEMSEAKRDLVKIGQQAYDEVITPEKLAIMKRLGEGFFGSRDTIRFDCEGRGSVILRFPEQMLAPFSCAAWGSALSVSEAVMGKLLAAERRVDSIQRQFGELSSKVRGIVASVRTTGGLIEVWPESVAFIPEVINRSANLPSAIVSDVSRALNLAKSEQVNECVQ